MPTHTKEKRCRRRSKEKKRAERLANAELTFSFALLRAESLKKCANGGRREPKCSKILNFTTLQKYSFDDALLILIVILRFEISSKELEMCLKMAYS